MTDSDSLASSEPPTPSTERSRAVPGGSRELIALALPLVLSNAFMTIQVTVDRVLLSHYGTLEVAAALPAVLLFWLPFALLQGIAGYATTFVAQYTGAHRPHRVGPAIWHGLHFSLVTGIGFLGLWVLAPWYVGLGGHDPQMTGLEITYFRCLCFAALPMLIVVTVSGFFSGRGESWVVLWINIVGTLVNVVLDIVMIPGLYGVPEMGIAGAGWATVAGSWASALVALGLFFRQKFRIEYATLSGWRPERELTIRLLRFGGPAGLQFMLDVMAFTVFTIFVARLGAAEAAATSIAITLNMFTFMPIFGIAMAVSILVGQRLGEDRPELAERSTYTGFRWAFGCMILVATVFVLFPETLVSLFATDGSGSGSSTKADVAFAEVAAVVPKLLIFIAVYSLADAANLVYAFALRGAGDTRFVTVVSFTLAWPVMVLPTIYIVNTGGNLYYAWGAASLYIMLLAGCCWLRFRGGKWKAMRVIEQGQPESEVGPPEVIGPAHPDSVPSTVA